MTISPDNPLDFAKRYAVDGYRGIAFRLVGWVIIEEYDDWGEATGDTYADESQVIAVMIGDDRRHIVEVADLEMLDDDAYCHVCGQIGCGHNA